METYFDDRLQPGSPAIDQGTVMAWLLISATVFPYFDNLSIPNAFAGDGTDVGAYEVQTADRHPLLLDSNINTTPTPHTNSTPTRRPHHPTPTPRHTNSNAYSGAHHLLPQWRKRPPCDCQQFHANWTSGKRCDRLPMDVSTTSSFGSYLPVIEIWMSAT